MLNIHVAFVSLQNDVEAYPQSQDVTGEVHDLTTHVSQIRGQNQDLRSQVSELTIHVSQVHQGLRSQVNELTTNVSQIRGQNQDLSRQVNDLQALNVSILEILR